MLGEYLAEHPQAGPRIAPSAESDALPRLGE